MPIMYGTATAIAPISSLVRRSKPVYVTLDCKYRLADELHFSTVANRWDEKAGLRTGCGVRSQVIDVLEAQIKRRPAMKKISTRAAAQSRNISQRKLTIGLDLGDCNSWYCVVDETGQIQLEQRVRTNTKALQE